MPEKNYDLFGQDPPFSRGEHRFKAKDCVDEPKDVEDQTQTVHCTWFSDEHDAEHHVDHPSREKERIVVQGDQVLGGH